MAWTHERRGLLCVVSSMHSHSCLSPKIRPSETRPPGRASWRFGRDRVN